jgi:DNA polymerase-1
MIYTPRSFLPGDIINVDYETSGFQHDPGARVFAFSLTWVEDGYTEVVRREGAARFYQDEKEIWRGRVDFEKRMRSFWASNCPAVTHNLKFEYAFTGIEKWEINSKKKLHDTMIMHQYIDNLCPSHALDYLFNRYHGKVGWISEVDKNISKAAKIYGSYDKIPEELMFPYQLADGIRGALLYKLFWPLVSPAKEYWNEIELIKATVDMEKIGFMLDKGQAEKLIFFMSGELAANKIETECIAGRSVNLLSEPQLKKLLFDDLRLPALDTTDKHAVEKLREINNHPILDCILKARSYTKGIAMVRGYIDAAKHDGCIHPGILTNRAGTGREASNNPNLQNVSKEFKAGARFTVPARRCFRARPGNILLLADYAGIEMRLAVQGTGSIRLFKLCQDDFDFHASCALAFYGDRYQNETDKDEKKALRSRAKNARFAMLYGAGLEQTAATLGLTTEEVRAGYERDKEEFPEFYELMSRCMKDARKQGYIETFFGRRLRVPLDRPFAATDYLIQGSAAALFKHAQVRVADYFRKTGNGKILIPVHDELVMEIPRSVPVKEITPVIEKLMIMQEEIVVKLAVEFGVCTYTWDNRKDL